MFNENNEDNEDINNSFTPPTSPTQQKLVDIEVTDENTALNIIVAFLSLAQKRGIFNFEESAKIFECIKIFQKPE